MIERETFEDTVSKPDGVFVCGACGSDQVERDDENGWTGCPACKGQGMAVIHLSDREIRLSRSLTAELTNLVNRPDNRGDAWARFFEFGFARCHVEEAQYVLIVPFRSSTMTLAGLNVVGSIIMGWVVFESGLKDLSDSHGLHYDRIDFSHIMASDVWAHPAGFSALQLSVESGGDDEEHEDYEINTLVFKAYLAREVTNELQ